MNEGETPVVAPLRNRLMLWINVICIIGAVVLLILSLWPGYVSGWVLLLALPSIALLGLFWIVIVIRAASGKRPPISWPQIIITPILVCSTYGALRYYIPRRIAFPLIAFTDQLPSAPPPGPPVVLNKRIGIYHVSQWATDPRGGVYFCTSKQSDLFGFSHYYHGFVYRPNSQGAPFGSSGYRVRRLSGDWYWFSSIDSDD